MLIRDHFQNFKSYQLPKAQLIIADVPYNLGNKTKDLIIFLWLFGYIVLPLWYIITI